LTTNQNTTFIGNELSALAVWNALGRGRNSTRSWATPSRTTSSVPEQRSRQACLFYRTWPGLGRRFCRARFCRRSLKPLPLFVQIDANGILSERVTW